MILVVDSTVWIDYFNGVISDESDYLHESIGRETIIVGDLILAEVLQGFRRERDFNLARQVLLNFPVMTMIGQANAVQSAIHYRTLRANGITIRKTIDCLIATFCLVNEFSLLHTDRDFEQIAHVLPLKIVRPQGR